MDQKQCCSPWSRNHNPAQRSAKERDLTPFLYPFLLQISNPEHDRLEAYPTSQALVADALAALEQSLQLWQKQQHQVAEGVVTAYLAEVALWLGDVATACMRADRAWELAAVRRFEADFIRAARLQGTAALRSLTLRVEWTSFGSPSGSTRRVKLRWTSSTSGRTTR